VISARDLTVGYDFINSTTLGSFNVATGKTLTVSGTFGDSFFGASSIIKDGAGTMILTGENYQSGEVDVRAGTLSVGDGSTSGTLGGGISAPVPNVPVNIDAGASLVINRSDSFDLANDLSGLGTVVLQGSGVTSLTGLNDGTSTSNLNGAFAGRFELQAGVLSVSAADKFGTSDDASATNLVFAGGALAYTDEVEALLRAFTVRNGGAGFVADGSNAITIGDRLTAQLDFDNGASTGRILTLGGTGVADHTFAPALLESEAAGSAFSSIVKNDVGKWIIATSGDALNLDAAVAVNAGILGFEAGALGGVSHTGDVTLADQATLRWEAGNTDDISSRLAASAGATSVTLDFAGGSTTFASSVDLGTTGLVKQGAGALTLSAASTVGSFTVGAGSVNVTHAGALGTGLATVEGGTLYVNAAISNDIDVNSGGTLGGIGSATLGDVDVATGGSVAPGNSPGTLTGTNLILAGGSTFVWEVRNASQAQGVGYDFLNLSGNLNLSSASSGNKVTLKIVSLDALNVAGSAELFANNMTANGGLGAFNTFLFGSIGSLDLGGSANINDVFSIDVSEFRYSDGSVSSSDLWSLSFDGGTGMITLTAVPEPSTYGFAMGALALAAAAVRRRRKAAAKQG